MIGQTISHYKITAKLGEGGMGVVYKAEDLKLGRAVALKFLPAHLLDSEEHKARFLHEARTAALLDHPNICTVYEIDEAEGSAFLAMACLEGQTLKQKIAERPLPLDEALDIAMQIGKGLQAAHEKAIVHRDIKPANIMLTAQGLVKIMDFGLAQFRDRTRLTATGTRLGTPAYMSPEQVEGRASDRRSDIWSLGVVLYEMVSGRLPFEGESEQAVYYGILNVEPEPVTALRSRLPVELDRIISKAISKSPEARYQHLSDFEVDLRALQKHSSPDGDAEQRRGQAAGSRHSASERWRTWRLVTVSAVLLAVMLTAYWFVHGEADEWEDPLAGARYTRLTSFEGMEADAAISPDGKFVAFLSERSGLFDAWVGQIGTSDFVNLTKGQFRDLFNERVRSVGFSGDGSHVWVRVEQRDTQTNVRTARAWIIPTLGGAPRPFLENAASLAWSPDGSRIVYHEPTGGDPLYVTENAGSNPSKLYVRDPGSHSHYPAWSPDGKFIYFVSGLPPDEMDVWRVPTDGGDAEQISNHRSRVAYPTLLDDRTLLYIASADDGAGTSIYAMDLVDRVSRRVSSGLEQYTSIAADQGSPGGARRLVATLSNPLGSLWMIPISEQTAGENEVVPRPVSSSQATKPRLGSDYLLYLSSTGPAHGLWKQMGDSATELWWADRGGVTGSPAISPDGRWICFSYRKEGRAGLYLMSADGTNVRLLTDAFQVRGSPSWSHDGKWVVVGGDQGDGGRIFKVPVEGGDPVRLLDTLSYHPVWSPDGRFIVYSGADVGAFHPIKAITPQGEPLSIPEIYGLSGVEGYRFLPDGSALVLVQGYYRTQNFWLLNFATGKLRQLTDLRPGLAIQGFDITGDGKRIVFDRVRENSDIVLIELPED